MPNLNTIATTRNPDAGEDPSGGRRVATEKNDAPENVLAIDSGTAHLSEKDIRKLKDPVTKNDVPADFSVPQRRVVPVH